jgi:hypothetical protein
MTEATATAERREEILGELAEWMHAAAREAQRRLLEAESTDDFVKLTASLAKLARGVRQSILIHRKLEAERLEAARRADEAAAGAETASEFVPRHVKRVRLRTAITRHVWKGLEGVEAELFHEDLNARLDELEGEDDFLDIRIDDLIARLCRDLGFEPPEPSPPPLGMDREARGADARRASGASSHPAGLGAAAEPMAEGARSATGSPAVHAPNTS